MKIKSAANENPIVRLSRFFAIYSETPYVFEQVDLDPSDKVLIEPADGSNPIKITVADSNAHTLDNTKLELSKYYSSIFTVNHHEGEIVEQEIILEEGDKVTVNPGTAEAVEFVIAVPETIHLQPFLENQCEN